MAENKTTEKTVYYRAVPKLTPKQTFEEEAGQIVYRDPDDITRIESGIKFVQEEPRKFGNSGVFSSGYVSRFDLLPRTFLERTARRFELGAIKFGDPFNYRKGFVDKDYIIDRINHIQEHFNAYKSPRNNEESVDDNLAAMAWGIAFLMEYEEWRKEQAGVSECKP